MVADKIDMSLDDIIASNKRGRGRGGRAGGGRGRGFSSNRRGGSGGPVRRGGRGSFRGNGNRTTPYSRPKNIPDRWEHDMYDGAGGAGGRGNTGGRRSEGLSTGSHLQISNLDFGVTETDIKELFSEFGKLKKAMINYDESGRSHGTADVVFERKQDALKAFNTYNGVPLDGRPMKIEAVTPTVTTISTASSGRRDTRSNNRFENRPRGGFRGSYNRGNRGGGRGRGGGGRGRRELPSKEDLDKELDCYIEKNDS